MGGGLMQLVAYGAQDIYLTGNPQITFFKVVYRRHTNFSMESIQQTFNGQAGPSGNPVCTISRNGDLVYKMYLVQTTTAPGGITNAHNIIKEVELEIGGQRIDKQTIDWMNTWNELSTPESKAIGLKSMQGLIGTAGLAEGGTGVNYISIPLLFWFCRNPGLVLPLIALQYHEVKVKFSLGEGADAGQGLNLFCDYIYLDTDERRRFAQVSHEYLIEQVQEQSTSELANKLNFNHPVKELIWSTPASVGKGTLKLNGHERFSTREAEYFELQQPYDYHTAVPRANLPSAAQLTSNYSELESPSSLGYAGLREGEAPSDNSGAVNNPQGSTRFSLLVTSETFSVVTTATAKATVAGGTEAVVGDGATAAVAAGEGPANTTVFTTATGLGTAAVLVTTEDAVNWKQYVGRLIRVSGEGLRAVNGGTTTSADVVLRRVVDAGGSGDGAILSGASLLYFDKNFFELKGDGTTETDITAVKAYLPSSILPTEARTSASTKKIGVYSFALKPEEHQPSGTCNFSRIDNAELTFSSKASPSGVIYAVNYNVLRIMSGMGGLAYSN
jgi:hypothetical protein